MDVCAKKPGDSDSSFKKKGHVLVDENLSNKDLSVSYDECYNCADEIQSRMRCFSEKAWSVLLLWKEINPGTVEKPICDYCYSELRAILMERIDEFDDAASDLVEKAEA